MYAFGMRWHFYGPEEQTDLIVACCVCEYYSGKYAAFFMIKSLCFSRKCEQNRECVVGEYTDD